MHKMVMGGGIQKTLGFPTGETETMVAPLTDWESLGGRKKGTGLREATSILGVCKILETQNSLYILQLLALYPAHSRC